MATPRRPPRPGNERTPIARKSRAAPGGPEVTVALSQADLAEELAGADLPAPAEKLTDPKAADLWPPWRRS